MAEFSPLVSVSETIAAPPEKVWDVVTHDTGTMFMGADVTTDWHVGHAISFKGEMKGKKYEDKGKVRTFEREKLLEFTHFSPLSGKPDAPENYNLVSVALKPHGSGTEVTLTQSTAAGGDKPDAKTTAEYRKNWQAMLGSLKKACEGKA